MVQGEDSELLYSHVTYCTQATFVRQELPEKTPIQLTAKCRYRQIDQPCTVTRVNDTIELVFKDKQRAVTPGQSAVLYDGDECIGGGIIEKTK